MSWPSKRFLMGWISTGETVHVWENDRRTDGHERSAIEDLITTGRFGGFVRPQPPENPQLIAYELVPVKTMDRIRAFHAEVTKALVASDAVEGPVEWGPDLDDSWNALPDEVKP